MGVTPFGHKFELYLVRLSYKQWRLHILYNQLKREGNTAYLFLFTVKYLEILAFAQAHKNFSIAPSVEKNDIIILFQEFGPIRRTKFQGV